MSKNEPKKKALIIAISDYENLPKLDFCKNNGREMSVALKKAGFDVADELIGTVSYDSMRRAINKFFRDEDIHSEDTILVYYSGHGDISEHGDKFFCSSNYDRKIPENDGLSFESLTDLMSKCNSQKKIAMVDSCYSGDLMPGRAGMGPEDDSDVKAASIRKDLKDRFENSQGQIVLASSVGTHKSFAHPDKPYSSFSYYLIEGLEGKAADEDGLVTVDTLYNYVFTEFQRMHLIKEQKPIKNGSVAGNSPILVAYPELVTKKLPVYLNPTIEAANVLLNIGRYEEALQNYKLLLEQDPENPELWYYSGVALSRISTKRKQARAAFARALNHYLNLPNHSVDAVTLYKIGKTHAKLHQLDNAISYYDKAIKADPNNPPFWQKKAIALLQFEEFEDALKCSEESLRLDSKNSKSWLIHGDILRELEKSSESLDSYEKSLELDPTDDLCWLRKASLLFELNLKEKAKIAFEKAKSIRDKRQRMAAYSNV